MVQLNESYKTNATSRQNTYAEEKCP